jgi:hypothetical protein
MITLMMVLLLGLTGVSPGELETSGSLPEAGMAWQEEGDLAGQARILCRLLEEALYAGHGVRARMLVSELTGMVADERMIDFWWARIAWIAGLEQLAVEELEAIPGDDWLALRARGMARSLARDPATAIPLLERSLEAATTTRRRFWSAVDLCWAELAAGNTGTALQMASFLSDSFPGDALPDVLRALCEYRSGNFASAMVLLQRVTIDPMSGTGPVSMARDLLEDFE